MLLSYHIWKLSQPPFCSSLFLLHATEIGSDLKYVILKAISKAKTSISLSSYGFSDPELDRLLQAKAQENLSITLIYDHTLPPPSILGENVSFIEDKKSGLMHRKIVVIDGKTLFLGSTNATESSYKLHYNHMIQMDDENLALAVMDHKPYETSDYRFFPLPGQKKEALLMLTNLIEKAEKRIYLAIFTLTHKSLIDKIIEAHHRGVEVQIVMDQQMARGVSIKATNEFTKHGLPINQQRGSSLLHHKCALIDNHFVLGSANWSKSGFERNREYLIVFENLGKTDLSQVEQFFNSVFQGSKRLQYSTVNDTIKSWRIFGFPRRFLSSSSWTLWETSPSMFRYLKT